MNSIVSVIVPVFNGEKYLAEALRSVREQTHSPIELIIVDDGSTDGSVAIAEQFEPDHLIVQKNAGVAGARNAALRGATGELICFLDQDDWWDPEKIRIQVYELEQNPCAGICMIRSDVILQDNQPWPKWLPGKDEEGLPDNVPPGCWMIRSSAFEVVGPFDESYTNGSDSEWLVRARKAGVKDIRSPCNLLKRRVHAENASHNMTVSSHDIFRILKANIRDRKIS